MDARVELLKLTSRYKALPMVYGWSCEYVRFRGGFVYYHIEKDGYHFYVNGRREMEWFCRVFSGTVPGNVLAAMESHLYNFSASAVLAKIKDL